MEIHIAVHEPNNYSSGGFEWRVDREKAEKEFRAFRGTDGTTMLFTDIPVPQHLVNSESDEITDWVDELYWNGGLDVMRDVLGEPTKTYSVDTERLEG